MSNESLNMKSLLQRAHSQGIRHGFIPFWAAMLGEVLEPVSPDTRILEFGAQSPDFLKLAYLAFPYAEGVGVILDIDQKASSVKPLKFDPPRLRFLDEASIDARFVGFDLAFSYEVLGLLPNLSEHATAIGRLLRPGGVYYATFGWHGDNPASSIQSAIRAENGLPFYPHLLGDVAEIFHSAGFEVGIKRLPLPYFLVYEPDISLRRFGGVPEMICCLQDQKILFAFRKEQADHG